MRKKDLPSFSALIAFEAAARHQSFKGAAEETCVSQAAISRQIRLLEEELGGELFERHHKAVKLNETGRLFLESVSLGLTQIEIATRQLKEQNLASSITIGLMSSLAGFLLSPKIGEFQRQFPEMNLHIVTLDSNPEPGKDHFDIMVTMGEATSPAYEQTHLFAEEVFPVCSPIYLNKETVPLADLCQYNLLNTDDIHWTKLPWSPLNWDAWFNHYGLAPPATSGLCFSNYQMMMNTVLSGHGICLGWKHLVSDLLKGGHLIKPIAEVLHPDRHHYLQIRKPIAGRQDIQAFKNWFLSQIQRLEEKE